LNAAVPIAFFAAGVAVAIYVIVAAIWFVPDSRIERRMQPQP